MIDHYGVTDQTCRFPNMVVGTITRESIHQVRLVPIGALLIEIAIFSHNNVQTKHSVVLGLLRMY